MTASAAEFLRVGEVQRPHGVRGELFVRLETDRPEAVFVPGRVLQVGDVRGTLLGRAVTVERARAFKDGVLLKLEGLASREDTELARGWTLLIPSSEAAPLAEGEIFVHELVGMEVRSREGVVGAVREVYDAPAGYLLAVSRPGGKGELMIPFVEALVASVDRETRVLEIEALPGLLDL